MTAVSMNNFIKGLLGGVEFRSRAVVDAYGRNPNGRATAAEANRAYEGGGSFTDLMVAYATAATVAYSDWDESSRYPGVSMAVVGALLVEQYFTPEYGTGDRAKAETAQESLAGAVACYLTGSSPNGSAVDAGMFVQKLKLENLYQEPEHE